MNSTVKYLFIFALLLSACGGEEEGVIIPSDVIAKETFSEIMAEVTLIEAVKNLNVSKEMKDADSFSAYYGGVWEKYGVDEAAFVRSFDFYKVHPKLMKEIYKASADRLKEYEADVNAKKKIKKEGETKKSKIDSLRNRTGERLPMTGKAK